MLAQHGRADSGSHHQSPEDRREKNRVAQRRFRERQRNTVTTLQAEIEAKEAEATRMAAQMRTLEQTNQVRHYQEKFITAFLFGFNPVALFLADAHP